MLGLFESSGLAQTIGRSLVHVLEIGSILAAPSVFPHPALGVEEGRGGGFRVTRRGMTSRPGLARAAKDDVAGT